MENMVSNVTQGIEALDQAGLEAAMPAAGLEQTAETAASNLEQANVSVTGSTTGSSGPGDPIKGGTKASSDNTPLWDANNKYLTEKRSKYNERLTSFLMDAFTISSTLPVVNGRRLQNLNQLPQYIEKYGQDLYSQALKVYDKPDVDIDQARILMTKQKLVDDAYSVIAQANKLMMSDLMNSAKHVNAEKKNNWYTVLFTPDGRLKGKSQAEKDISALRAQIINQGLQEWEKQNPFPEFGPDNWMRTDMPNPAAGKWFKDPVTGQLVQIDTRPKLKDSKEGWYMSRQWQMNILSNSVKNLNYDDVYRKVIEQYNKNAKTKRLSAAQEGVYQNNAGGGKTALTKQEIIFDVDKAVKVVDGQARPTEQMEYTVDFLKNAASSDQVRFSFGTLDETNVKVPTNNITRDLGKQFLQTLLEDIQFDILNENRTKGAEKRPVGTISFVPIAGGDDNYHAYHIKLGPEYFKQYQGTKDSPGRFRNQADLINKGVTVFIPKEFSESKIKIGKEASKGTKITNVEAQIALSEDGVFSRRIPGAMEYNIKVDRNTGRYTVTGNVVSYNPQTGKMDTVNINTLGIQSSFDLSVDIDQIENNLFKIGLDIYKSNKQDIRDHSKLRGVKEPNLLSPQQ